MLPKTIQKQKNNFLVRVAYDTDEIKRWTERIIVVDLFRFSNTVCALMASGRKNIRIYSDPKCAIAAKKIEKNVDLFSEMDFPFVNYYDNPTTCLSPKGRLKKMGGACDAASGWWDNSPYLAMNLAGTCKDAIIVTRSGSKTVMASVSAKEIIIGCFANMPCLCEYVLKNKMDTLIAPACLFYDRNHTEDFICSRALQDAFNGEDTFHAALEEIHKSSRVLDLIALRPDTGRKDIEMVLKKGTIKVLPKAVIKGVFAESWNIYDEKK
ncbi:MAG: 2-phosphosulfolactate phosphatase [Elusimicrobia bacterium]|nr:2-phosphosulfolactate phosphatase [Elusimicrobiota bacterium]